MLRSIYSKFILGYILFGLIGFITVAIFSQKMTYDYLVRQNSDKLYDEAMLMAATYEDNNFFFTDINAAASRDISMVANFINARIWVTDRSGRIVLDSDSGSLNNINITGFDPASDPAHYRIGTYYGMFSEEMLSVEAPINYNYAPIGYILIHYPMRSVVSSTNEILNIVYLSAVIIFLLALIILVVFTFYVYIPLRDITFAAREYAAGHLDYKIRTINRHDEVSYLGDTLNYMASELEDMEKYKRDNNLDNIVFIPYQAKEDLVYSLNAADVHFVVNAKGIKGVSVPSKIYGVMAAAKPVLGILEEGTEARMIIEESGCGKVADPGDYNAITETIQYYIDNKDSLELVDMGNAGRSYLEAHLTKGTSLDKYAEVLSTL